MTVKALDPEMFSACKGVLILVYSSVLLTIHGSFSYKYLLIGNRLLRS